MEKNQIVSVDQLASPESSNVEKRMPGFPSNGKSNIPVLDISKVGQAGVATLGKATEAGREYSRMQAEISKKALEQTHEIAETSKEGMASFVHVADSVITSNDESTKAVYNMAEGNADTFRNRLNDPTLTTEEQKQYIDALNETLKTADKKDRGNKWFLLITCIVVFLGVLSFVMVPVGFVIGVLLIGAVAAAVVVLAVVLVVVLAAVLTVALVAVISLGGVIISVVGGVIIAAIPVIATIAGAMGGSN